MTKTIKIKSTGKKARLPTVRIEQEKKDKFGKKCSESGASESDVLRGFVDQVISGEYKIIK